MFVRLSPRLVTRNNAVYVRAYSAKAKIVAPPMVYISGEEMTHYCMNLIMDEWIKPRFDITAWEFYDLSCVARDQTDDQGTKRY